MFRHVYGIKADHMWIRWNRQLKRYETLSTQMFCTRYLSEEAAQEVAKDVAKEWPGFDVRVVGWGEDDLDRYDFQRRSDNYYGN